MFASPVGAPSTRTAQLADALRRAGIAAETPADMRAALWEKFAVVCATGGVMALTRLPAGPVRSYPATRAFFHAAIAEAVAVGRAVGVALPEPDTFADGFLAQEGRYPPWAKSSMLTDLEAGRRLELDAITGTTVRLGRVHGVPTPANTAIYAALQPYADGAPTIPTPPPLS